MKGWWRAVTPLLLLLCMPITVRAQSQVVDDPFPVTVGLSASTNTPFEQLIAHPRMQSQWSRGVDMPVKRGYMGSVYLDSALYVFGGLSKWEVEPTAYRFSLATGSWTTLDSMPTKRALPIAESVNGMIYLCGGYSKTVRLEFDASVIRFDPSTETYTRMNQMPMPVFAAGSFVHEGRIFLLGGGRHDLNTQTDTIQIYDPGSDTWMISPSMLPRAMRSFGTVYLNGAVYTFGGYAYAKVTGTFHGEVYKGVIEGDSIEWTRMGDLPGGPLIRMSAGTDGRTVYLTGGFDETTNFTTYPTNRTWSYDPATDLWTELEPKPTPVQYASRMLYDDAGRFYVAGGVDHTQYRSEVEVFDPSMPVSDVEIIPTETDITLEQNHPNPFNPSTTIVFSLPTRTQVELVVHDSPGREVTRLVDGTREAGVHRVVFDGGSFPSGVYRTVLRAGGRTLSRSMVLVR
jgi:N-acetylneuraminic acid mutarotase